MAYNQAGTGCNLTQVPSSCTGLIVGNQTTNEECGQGGPVIVPGAAGCRRSAGSPVACVWTAPDPAAPAAAGTCQPVPHGKRGDPRVGGCPKTATDCAFDTHGTPLTLCFESEGLYCSTRTSPASCAPVVGRGESCAADPMGCDSSSYCDSASATCKPLIASGQAGTATDACASGYQCSSAAKCAALPLADPDITRSGIVPVLK
jgi:hypothetical protein